MKKLINMKLYSEQEAENITECLKIDPITDITEFRETLFKTKKWNYFLVIFKRLKSENKKSNIKEDIKVIELFNIFKWFEKNEEYFSDYNKWKFYHHFKEIIIEA